jgi:hypothetical protein
MYFEGMLSCTGGHRNRSSQVFGLDVAHRLPGEVWFGAQKIPEGPVAVDPPQIVEDLFGRSLANLVGG